LANYLPLAGGSMTGTKINRNVDTSKLVLGGGSTGGALLEIYGKNFSDEPALKGGFAVYTNDGTNSKVFKGVPNGTLTWGNANVLTDANGGYLPLSGGTMTGVIYRSRQYPYYMRIFGGPEGEKCASIDLMGAGFDDTDKNSGRVVLTAKSDIDTDRTQVFIKRDGRITAEIPAYNSPIDIAGSAIVSKSLGTNGYIKYASGLIMQWGQSSNVTRWDFPITFPTAVIGVYAGIKYTGEQSGYNAVKTLTTSYLEPSLQS
jgi:hypothetical protein